MLRGTPLAREEGGPQTRQCPSPVAAAAAPPQHKAFHETESLFKGKTKRTESFPEEGQLCHRSQRQLRLHPRPGGFHKRWVWPTKSFSKASPPNGTGGNTFNPIQ